MVEQGLPTCMVRCIRDFLANRSAKINVNGYESKAFKLKAGVPQGGVLLPNLFTLYINELRENTYASLFADDLAL